MQHSLNNLVIRNDRLLYICRSVKDPWVTVDRSTFHKVKGAPNINLILMATFKSGCIRLCLEPKRMGTKCCYMLITCPQCCEGWA